ncbi:MAG: hypothetical protein ACLQO7_06630 [Candidatus Bathyarchaeia archaeon]
MTTVLNPKGFKLPRVDRDKFVTLMNLGLDYNRERGLFSIKDCNNIEKLIDTLAGILGTEVVFLQSCIRCGKEFPCADCKYLDLCATKNLPLSCVCPHCLRTRKQLGESLEKF